MRNFVELYKILKDHTDEETLSYLVYEHREEIINELKKIKHNNTTRKAALESYKKNVGKIEQDAENGIYCDGHTAISLAVTNPHYNEELGAFKYLYECVKAKRRPAPLKDSIGYAIASARIDGWKIGDTTHYIRVGDATYNLSLVVKVFNVIADPKNYNDCDIEIVHNDNPELAILLLRTRYGFGIVLPFRSNKIGLYDVTPGESTLDKMIKDHEKRGENAV